MKKMIDLANKYRPTSLDSFVGQSHIISKDKALYKLIKQKRYSSSFFFMENLELEKLL